MAQLRGENLVDYHVDMELLIARMKNMDANLRDLTKIYRQAVKPIFAGYRAVAPKGPSGDFRRDIFKQATYRFGSVGLLNTGRAADPKSHSGVTEFGGTIPVPHSRTNPRLEGHRRLLSKRKPWIGGRFGTSYYLYPMWDRRWREVVPPFIVELKRLCAKYMPKI